MSKANVSKAGKEKEHALVQVLQPSTTTAFEEAKAVVEMLPALRLPVCVRDAEAQAVCTDLLRQVATAAKVVEEKRKSVTMHLDAAKKALNKLFEPLKRQMADLRQDLEGKLDEYRDWQEEQAEVEREKLRKRAEAQRKRAEAATQKKLEEARSRQERAQIKAKATAKASVAEAILEARLDAIDDTPDVEEGVAVIEDVEIVDLDISKVPETVVYENEDGSFDDLIMWTRQPVVGNIKKMGRAGYRVLGVEFKEKRRRAVRT